MKEYDLFIPLYYNDGSPVEGSKLQALQDRLLEHSDGLTFFPQPNQGFRKAGGVTYRDQIIILRVLSAKPRAARKILTRLKNELKQELRQEEILIIERDVRTL